MLHIPPDQVRLQTNYSQAYSTLGAAALMMGIVTLAIFMMGESLTTLAKAIAALGIIWLPLTLAFGLVNVYRVRRERRHAQALLSEDYWAEWQWSPDEWQQQLTERRADFEKWREFRYRGAFGCMLVVSTVAIAGTPLFIALVSGDAMPSYARNFLFVLSAFFGLFSITLSLVGTWNERRKRQQQLERAELLTAPRVRLGPYGFYHEADGHTPLYNLSKVAFSPKKQDLTFYIRHSGPQGTGSFDFPTALPVPAAHIADARAIVQRYESEYGL
jgi:hypothetical protein